MYVGTRHSMDRSDTVMTPKKLLIVRELPEAQPFVSTGNPRLNVLSSGSADSLIRPLNISVELDSTEYHPRSLVKAKIKVTDKDGNPVRAKITVSVYDRLYSYPQGELDIVSHCIGMAGKPRFGTVLKHPFLPDGPVTGKWIPSNNKKNQPIGGQYINVFDFSDNTGNVNFVGTGEDGSFEITTDIASSLGWDLLLKPVSGKDMKPSLKFGTPFDDMENVRKRSKDRYYPMLVSKDTVGRDSDSIEFTGRKIVRLDEIVVKGHAGRYPKRNKLLGYLDSISSMSGTAWVCGCPAGHGTTFLNDYIPGYTHHPDGYGHPHKISKPVKGRSYELIKYSGGSVNDYVVDIQYIEYSGPQYTEEELLRKNGLWKAKGFYPKHRFENPDAVEMALGLDDNRNTLFWNPEIETNENGETNIEFFTSDIVSRFIIAYNANEIPTGGVGSGFSIFIVANKTQIRQRKEATMNSHLLPVIQGLHCSSVVSYTQTMLYAAAIVGNTIWRRRPSLST